MVRLFTAALLGLILTLLVTPQFIAFMRKIDVSQVVSEFSLEEFKSKASTPIMGGVVFILVPIIATIILYPHFYENPRILILFMVYAGYGLIGFIDDYLIVVKKNNDGLKPLYKFLMQVLFSVIFYVVYHRFSSTTITLPFINLSLDLGWFYAVFVFFLLTGSSNALNLTDGMDGLASGLMVFALLPFIYSALKQEQFLIAVFLAAVEGSLLGYLRYNISPALIFMGDTGSLALGALLASSAILLKREINLAIIGGVFVAETLCVIIQQVAVRVFHKKVFTYTPIHYSFKIRGTAENQVVYAFWLWGIICAGLGFLMEVLG